MGNINPSLSELQRTVAAIINYNTATLTSICIESLLNAGLPRVLVLDNNSSEEDANALKLFVASRASRVHLICSDINLGFAAGCNQLIEEILNDLNVSFVLLLNSDAVARAEGIKMMIHLMSTSGYGLVGARVVQHATDHCINIEKPHHVDSLGITLYRPLLASNRKSLNEAYLGPTAGCAIYSRLFLETVKRVHGYIFDPSFFCYAEDTDLCLRARLIGFEAGYVDEVAAAHVGQASSGGKFNNFVLYHGIRNSIWTLGKTVPFPIILLSVPWLIILHAGIFISQLLQGNGRILRLTYRDAVLGLGSVMYERRRIQATRKASIYSLYQIITPRFYEKHYIKRTLDRIVTTLLLRYRRVFR